MSNLPQFLKPYFWDVNFEKLDPEAKAEYIVNRLLDKGDWRAARWATDNFPAGLIRRVLRTRKDFSLKNASFWSLIYQVPLSEVKCFQEPYRTLRKTLWPY